ncbi:MAG TPA: MerR family transcriptional regulator [Chitinophagaceae bacterium]|nr:MerR family transcriptional regulator [Chitinophagaceae bacterium]
MNTFTIRDIENLSGIKAHTWRAWEQRYGIIRPMRKDSNHRLYGIEDLKHILRIAYLYGQGYKISRIAEMDENQIRKLSLEFKSKGNHEIFINQLMEASIDFEEGIFRKAMDNAVISLGLEKAMILVIYPFLTKIGLLWMTGNIIPAQEHFASNIIRNKILAATERLPVKKNSSLKKYILFNPPSEYHEIPLLFVQYSLKLRGISNVLFGINTSIDFVRDYQQEKKATHLFLFMATNFTNKEPLELIEELKINFPAVQINVAGYSFRNMEITAGDRVKLFTSVQDFLNYLDR